MSAERSISIPLGPAAQLALASSAHAAVAQAQPPLADTTSPDAAPVPLPDDVAVLQAMIRELLAMLQQTRHERDGVRERLDLLLRKLYGPKAERFDPNQPWLLPEMAPGAANADEAIAAADAPPADAPATTTAKAKGHGRQRLPADLRRQRVEHTLAEAERLCPDCGAVCPKFGEDISEQLDYVPASVFVWQHVRCKYACTKCHDHVTVAPAPVAVITKGLPGPGLLAQIAASKYADHLPLHRLERILGRHGITLARSTMCDWMAHVAGMLDPVVSLMAALVRQSKALHTDATKLPYLDPALPGQTRSGQLWAYVGDRDHAFDVFDFCRDHSARGIDAVSERLPVCVGAQPWAWLSGRVAVFAHPYVAVTDVDGAFTIKDAPAGKYRLVIWNNGYSHGAKGRYGQPVVIRANGTVDLGDIAFQPPPE